MEKEKLYLLDDISCAMLSLEKANTIMQDIAGRYFYKASIESDEEVSLMRFDYEQYSTKANIVVDYICETAQQLKEVCRALQAALDRDKETGCPA